MAGFLQTLSTEQQLIGCTRKRLLMPHSWQTPDKSRCDTWQRCVLPSRAHTPDADASSQCMDESRAAVPCRLHAAAPCHGSAPPGEPLQPAGSARSPRAGLQGRADAVLLRWWPQVWQPVLRVESHGSLADGLVVDVLRGGQELLVAVFRRGRLAAGSSRPTARAYRRCPPPIPHLTRRSQLCCEHVSWHGRLLSCQRNETDAAMQSRQCWLRPYRQRCMLCRQQFSLYHSRSAISVRHIAFCMVTAGLHAAALARTR